MSCWPGWLAFLVFQMLIDFKEREGVQPRTTGQWSIKMMSAVMDPVKSESVIILILFNLLGSLWHNPFCQFCRGFVIFHFKRRAVKCWNDWSYKNSISSTKVYRAAKRAPGSKSKMRAKGWKFQRSRFQFSIRKKLVNNIEFSKSRLSCIWKQNDFHLIRGRHSCICRILDLQRRKLRHRVLRDRGSIWIVYLE